MQEEKTHANTRMEFDTLKTDVEKVNGVVDWIADKVIQKKWSSLLVLIDFVLFLAFNPFQRPLPNLLTAFPELLSFGWYKHAFWSLVVTIFVSAVTVAALAKRKPAGSAEVKPSAIKGSLSSSPFDSADLVVQLTRCPRITVDYDRDVVKVDVEIGIMNFGDHDVPIYSGKCAIRIGVQDFLTLDNNTKVTLKAKGNCTYTFTSRLPGVASMVDEFFEPHVVERCGSCAFQFSVAVSDRDVIEAPAQPACIGLAVAGGPHRRAARRQSAGDF